MGHFQLHRVPIRSLAQRAVKDRPANDPPTFAWHLTLRGPFERKWSSRNPRLCQLPCSLGGYIFRGRGSEFCLFSRARERELLDCPLESPRMSFALAGSRPLAYCHASGMLPFRMAHTHTHPRRKAGVRSHVYVSFLENQSKLIDVWLKCLSRVIGSHFAEGAGWLVCLQFKPGLTDMGIIRSWHLSRGLPKANRLPPGFAEETTCE